MCPLPNFFCQNLPGGTPKNASRSMGFWIVLCLLFRPLYSMEEVDRLLAAVNGRVITEGDVKVASNLNALVVLGRAAGMASKEEEAERLIDLELMRQELENFASAPAEQSKVELQLEELRLAYAEIGGLSSLLRRLGLQESELRTYVALQASILKFVDLRFRPFVSVTDDDVKTYYQERLIPRLQSERAPLPALAEVSPKIEKLLREEKVNAALEAWIQEIRRHSKIEIFISTNRAEAKKAP